MFRKTRKKSAAGEASAETDGDEEDEDGADVETAARNSPKFHENMDGNNKDTVRCVALSWGVVRDFQTSFWRKV